MLSFGIIGLPMVGKTTIFNLITGSGAKSSDFFTGKTQTNVGMARVPDPRLDFLAELYKPRRPVYAQVQCSDVPGLVRGASQGKGIGNQFLDGIRNVDLLVHVVRAFANPDVPHIDGDIDPLRDIETVNLELLFADMELIEKRINRLTGSKKMTKEGAAELELLKSCLSFLEKGLPLHQADLQEEDRSFLRNYNFFTEKPLILVINTDEEQFKSKEYPRKEEVFHLTGEQNIKLIEVCGKLEAEINLLDPEEQEAFLADLGTEGIGTDRLCRTAYEQLGLISFFTIGNDEVKAWPIKRGLTARQAAGKVHSDMERGFIRAEVVSYSDLFAAGSMARAKEKGLVRLEGKNYIVEDGDVVLFRFNV